MNISCKTPRKIKLGAVLDKLNITDFSYKGALRSLIGIILPAFLLIGCAGYQVQTAGTVNALQGGNVDGAIADLESKNTSKDKDLLYHFEKGELLRMKGSYEASRDEWLIADERVRVWEDQVKTDSAKLLGNIGSVLVNDTTRVYDGRDYEKVFLSVRLALNHVALGNWDNARTEIKKMHEREAIIADFHLKEVEAAKKTADQKGLKATSFKELDGYPVETLLDPAVQSLKNSYESAFANYLAGFVYEELNEPSLAAPGYRKASEMRPNDPVIDAALSGLDSRSGRRVAKMVDTLFVIETGTAPAIKSKTIPIVLPIPSKGGIDYIATPLSWPVITPSDTSIVPSSIIVDDVSRPVTLLTNVDVMARRALADEMPGIIVRSSIRAITKGIGQKLIDDNTANLGMAGLFIGLAAKVATIASEVADERAWRTLPGFFSITRMQLPEGTHKVALQTSAGLQVKEIQVSGRYALVSLRTSGASLYVAQSPYEATPATAVVQETASPLPVGVTPKPVAKTQSKPAAKATAVPVGGATSVKQPVGTTAKATTTTTTQTEPVTKPTAPVVTKASANPAPPQPAVATSKPAVPATTKASGNSTSTQQGDAIPKPVADTKPNASPQSAIQPPANPAGIITKYTK